MNEEMIRNAHIKCWQQIRQHFGGRCNNVCEGFGNRRCCGYLSLGIVQGGENVLESALWKGVSEQTRAETELESQNRDRLLIVLRSQ